jgi:hypothetical protein
MYYHLGDKYEYTNQQYHDILLVFALVFLPMEGFVEENGEEYQQSNATWPCADGVAFYH